MNGVFGLSALPVRYSAVQSHHDRFCQVAAYASERFTRKQPNAVSWVEEEPKLALKRTTDESIMRRNHPSARPLSHGTLASLARLVSAPQRVRRGARNMPIMANSKSSGGRTRYRDGGGGSLVSVGLVELGDDRGKYRMP